MLSRFYKIKDKTRISKALKSGTRRSFSCFTALLLKNPRAASDHFGVIASKKTAPLAVDRNRIRRRLYEAIRLSYEPLVARHVTFAPGTCYDVVILARHKIMTEPFTLIQSEITSLINQLHYEQKITA